MHEVSTVMLESQRRHPLITQRILSLMQSLTLQTTGGPELFATPLTNSVMDIRTTLLCIPGNLDKKGNSLD